MTQFHFRPLLLVCLLALSVTAAAQQPQVRVAITPDVVSVGEPVEIRVTVLVPTWFTSPPRFPSLELANTITRQPPDSSHPTSERIGGETWSGIIHVYAVYPLAAATYRLDDLNLEVTYADPNTRKPTTVDVTMPDIEIRAQVPHGAATLDPYLSGTRLTLSLDIEGDTDALEIGDAVVLRYTAELDGLPAMFLPPLFAETELPGVSVYVDEPVVSDGDVARRSETVTLVFEAGGEFEVPAATLVWWDTRNSVIASASTEAAAFVVAGPPLPATATEAPPAGTAYPIRLIVFVTAALGLLALSVPRLVRRMRRASQRYRESEAFAFKRLRKAFGSGDARSVHKALILWLDKAGPDLDLRRFAVLYGDDALSAMLDDLSRSLFKGGNDSAALKPLESGIARARRNFRRQSARRRRFALPPLNP